MQAAARQPETQYGLSEVLSRAILLGATTLHEAQNGAGALDCEIKPIDPAMKLAGPAFTISAQPGDNLVLHYAITKAPPGSVLVIHTHGDTRTGMCGDILADAARHRGIAGLVTDGAVRDVDGMIRLGFPVFAKRISVGRPQKCRAGEVGLPIRCGGADVNHGDIIVADRDGVVVIAAGELRDVMHKAERRNAMEERLRDELAKGRSTLELMGLGEILKQQGYA